MLNLSVYQDPFLPKLIFVTISIKSPSLIRGKRGDIRVAMVLTLDLTKLRVNRLLNIDLTYFT